MKGNYIQVLDTSKGRVYVFKVQGYLSLAESHRISEVFQDILGGQIIILDDSFEKA